MAIDFVHDQDIDLAIFSLTGKFDLEEWLSAARAGAFPPAFIEIMDLRRCNLNAMRSMDLARFTRYLRSAMDRGRLIPGKTAILAIKDGPAALHLFRIAQEAARIIRELNPDGIDINMGCSVRKVAGKGAGAATFSPPFRAMTAG